MSNDRVIKSITAFLLISGLSWGMPLVQTATAKEGNVNGKKNLTIQPAIESTIIPTIEPTTEIPLWSPPFLVSQQVALRPAEHVNRKGTVTQISNPRMQVYVQQKSNHKAILVLSGGGYAREAVGHEGTPASQWLVQQGFTVFNLLYRLPNEGWANKQVAFADGQRAMRIIRQKAGEYGYTKVGAMGFSAGGHLAGMLAVFPNQNFYPPQDSMDKNSAKPDFVVMLYPIVSMLPEHNHTRSHRELLGKHATEAQEKALSIEQWVDSTTPPMFIAHAKDDSNATVEKSIVLDQNLKKAGVKEKLVIFDTGGHGWGIGRAGTPTITWKESFLNWVKQL